MNQIKNKIITTLSLISVFVISFTVGYYGRNITFEKQWPLFEALRTTSAIIFAVVGAWMAIVYPEKIKSPFKKTYNESGFESSRLLTPIANSTFILIIVLIIGIFAPIVRQISPEEYHESSRGISYGILFILTFWQIWTVIATLIPADAIKNKIEKDEEKKESTDEIFKLTTKKTD